MYIFKEKKIYKRKESKSACEVKKLPLLLAQKPKVGVKRRIRTKMRHCLFSQEENRRVF